MLLDPWRAILPLEHCRCAVVVGDCNDGRLDDSGREVGPDNEEVLPLDARGPLTARDDGKP